jgi:ABC-type nickel/cobalt efflux system permease component RcnA
MLQPSDGLAPGFAAGLIPCPLALFVMTVAIARGAPEVGVAFAAVKMIGPTHKSSC